MRAIVSKALEEIKQDPLQHIDSGALKAYCEEIHYEWRDRSLNPLTTIYLFLLQILHGNTACSHLRHLSGKDFTDSAYCQARMRLPLRVFQWLLRILYKLLVPLSEKEGLWKERHRVFLMDGSSFSMPETKALRDHFGLPGGQQEGCGFPMAQMVVLFHAATGFLMDVIASPWRTGELPQGVSLHENFHDGDVLVGDRGFCSYAHLALLWMRGVLGLFRAHQRHRVDFTPQRPYCHPRQRGKLKGLPRSRQVRLLGVKDQIVEWFQPLSPPRWMSASQYATLPASLVVRELCYRVAVPGFRTQEVTLITTLLDEELYSAKDLAELYGMRWQAETHLAELKTTMGMDTLRCTTVEGVLKELMMFALVYNLVHLVMLKAAHKQGVPLHRISFIDALRWLASPWPQKTLDWLKVNPYRPHRVEPRAKKRRPKKYPHLARPRQEVRQEMLRQSVGA